MKDFHKKHKNWGDGDEGADAQKDDDDPMAMFKSLWGAPFMPNLLNTVVFLVETSQMVAVLFVNYKGRPWMKGLLENHALFLSVFLCAAGVAVCAWAVNPQLNGLIHLAEFPDDAFRLEVMRLVAYSLAGSFAWDRLVTALFAPNIFAAMLDSARETTARGRPLTPSGMTLRPSSLPQARETTAADLAPLAATIGKVLGGVFLLAQGNLLVLGGVYWMYSQHKKAQAAQEDA